MNIDELKEVFRKAGELDQMDQKEVRLNGMVKDELYFIKDQDKKNKIVNRVAQVIREEFGEIAAETKDFLESIRIGGEPEKEVSVRTLEKRLKKARELEKERKLNEKNDN